MILQTLQRIGLIQSPMNTKPEEWEQHLGKRLLVRHIRLNSPVEEVKLLEINLPFIKTQNQNIGCEPRWVSARDWEIAAHLPEQPSLAMAWKQFVLIEVLRKDVGSVTILCDNDEANTKQDQFAIDCSAEFTDWQEKRYYGESILHCLLQASVDRSNFIQKQHEQPKR